MYTNIIVIGRNIFPGCIYSVLYLSLAPSYAHQQKPWAYTFSFSFSVCVVVVTTHMYTHSNKWNSLSYGLYMYLDKAFQFWTNTWWQLWMNLFIFLLKEGMTILGLLCVLEIFYMCACMRASLTEYVPYDTFLTLSYAFKFLFCLFCVTALFQKWI